MTTKEIGNAGEELAAEELAGKGYAIIDSNVLIGNVEVDILAQAGGRLVVVEVKTRSADHLDERFGIDRNKLQRLCRAGANYVKIKNLSLEVQIDTILITNYPDGRSELQHLEDIALPPMRRRH
ncbi:MAG: YraN family protein [Bacteroides sp.]|nr:YraN family protein [Bacteroides sp.]MCM1379446.1 YraN family protein [Bacteroides sp.]MCM1445307.1 YraN family protein [Prevotella sp.]